MNRFTKYLLKGGLEGSIDTIGIFWWQRMETEESVSQSGLSLVCAEKGRGVCRQKYLVNTCQLHIMLKRKKAN